MANATVWSNSANQTGSGTVSLDNTRRVFNFGDRVAELAPQQSPFFVSLSKVVKTQNFMQNMMNMVKYHQVMHVRF